MHIIFGGAYQGKLDYVKERFHIGEEDIFYCDGALENPVIDFTKKVVYKLEGFTLACTKQQIEAKTYLEEHRVELADKIIICADISQGIVPMDKELRQWREMNGRTMIYLSHQAEEVTRIFCGLPQTLKKNHAEYIHLIRHGTTEGNVKKWYYGSSDIPLADEGKILISDCVKKGIYPRVTEGEFYTSGLLRTEQTFELIFGGREHGVISDFAEMDFGNYEKLCHEELKDEPEYQAWIEDKTGFLAPPKGESRKTFQARVVKGFEALAQKQRKKENERAEKNHKDKNSVVVCHGGVISVIMAEYFPKKNMHFYQWIPDPGHGYTIKLKEGVPQEYIAF